MNANGIVLKNENESSSLRQNGSKISVLSSKVYGFNPGETMDIKTGIEVDIPKGKAIVICPAKPLTVIGNPIFTGKMLTIRLHNSQIGKYGAHIISRGDKICDLIVMEQIF